MQTFKYREEKSDIFGKIKRPIITLEIYSHLLNIWLTVENALADSGADISLLPKTLGANFVGDITKGKEVKLRGIVPFAKLAGYIHTLRIRIAGEEFEAPFVIVDSDYTHPIFGRKDALDKFTARFEKGRETVLDI